MHYVIKSRRFNDYILSLETSAHGPALHFVRQRSAKRFETRGEARKYKRALTMLTVFDDLVVVRVKPRAVVTTLH